MVGLNQPDLHRRGTTPARREAAHDGEERLDVDGRGSRMPRSVLPESAAHHPNWRAYFQARGHDPCPTIIPE